MNREKTAVAAGAVALLFTLPLSAQELPPDEAFDEAKVVGVQPVLLMSSSLEHAWAGVAATLGHRPSADGAAALKAIGMPALPEQKAGFSFAGESEARDVAALHFGYLLGRLAAHAAAGDEPTVKAMQKWLKTRQASLDFLSEDVQKAVDAALASAATGRMDGSAIARALRAGEQGIADGPQRGHGYFVAGLWSGAALVAAVSPDGRDTLASMAAPLAAMLRQDSAFEGSDRKIADHIERIGQQLAARSPNVELISASGKALLSVRADAS